MSAPMKADTFTFQSKTPAAIAFERAQRSGAAYAKPSADLGSSTMLDFLAKEALGARYAFAAEGRFHLGKRRRDFQLILARLNPQDARSSPQLLGVIGTRDERSRASDFGTATAIGADPRGFTMGRDLKASRISDKSAVLKAPGSNRRLLRVKRADGPSKSVLSREASGLDSGRQLPETVDAVRPDKRRRIFKEPGDIGLRSIFKRNPAAESARDARVEPMEKLTAQITPPGSGRTSRQQQARNVPTMRSTRQRKKNLALLATVSASITGLGIGSMVVLLLSSDLANQRSEIQAWRRLGTINHVMDGPLAGGNDGLLIAE